MKRTPLLEFEPDPAVAHGLRVEEILRNLRDSPRRPATTARGADDAGATGEPAAGAAETIGMVVVDKEAGWTSHDAVARCRRIFSQRRVGHAGTLDPDATGVLLVGLGRFTRMLRFLTGLPKSYEAEVVLGRATSTLDASGEVTGTWDMAGVTLAEVRKAAASLTGVIDQVPPMVSAAQGGRAPAARAGPRRDRGRAGGPARHGRPLRRAALARRRARACSASRWTARRAPTSGCWPPTSGARPRRRRPPAEPAPHPHRLVRRRRGPHPRRRSTAAHVLTPGAGAARPAAGRARRRDGALGLARAGPRQGVGGRRRATGPGPCSTGRGGCWPSTRRPAPIAWWRRACWPAG